MASKLEDRLLLGERIVYRARHDLKSATLFIGSVFVLLCGVALGLEWFFSDGPDWKSAIIDAVLDAAVIVFLFSWWMWNHAVLVTDQRVLFSHGLWKAKIDEVPLQQIVHVTYSGGVTPWGGSVEVDCRDREDIVLRLVPRFPDLRDAIIRQCGLP